MSETVFKQVNYNLGDLTSYVELGEIGLPDIQRPFVWKNAKVRDLFDSMYQGYPVGYLLLWQNAYDEDVKVIGTDSKQKPPRLLIVDGQQRLTSLYAVVKGIPVVRENYDAETIEIAFNPLQEKFAVADAAIRRDKAYITNISKVWSGTSLVGLLKEYLGGLESTREVSEAEQARIEKALTKLHGLLSFPFTALELAAHISEEQVGDVFVRINSKGTPLNQADFIWDITLPTELATSAARSPSMFAYFAALNLLDARVLFSDRKVSELMDPATAANKASLERHHLFPNAYLKTLGVTDTRETNQIANFAMVEWGDNVKISDTAPADYVPVLMERFSGKELERMYYWHALPDGWEHLDYADFLRQRRELMASVIRDAYQRLAGAPSEAQPIGMPVADLVGQGETTTVEFKSTLRVNLHTGEKDPRMELAVLKTLAAFVNASGGNLVIGVADDGEPVGIEADKFPSEDKMYLHLVNLVKDRMGAAHMMYLHPRFDDYDGTRVLAVECLRGKSPVFVKDGKLERFYIRTGAATTELTASQTQEFVKQRFGGSPVGYRTGQSGQIRSGGR